MTEQDVIDLLEQNQNKRGIENWIKLHGEGHPLKSFGIGLTQLRKLAKTVGRSHELAQQLWQSDWYDVKVIALLIDEPKKITKEQAEAQVEALEGGYLAHVFSSCDATLAKTSFAIELSDEWIQSEDEVRQRCGYGLLYETSKSKKKSAPDNDYFIAHIKQIEQNYSKASINILMAMAGALNGMGVRNIELHKKALPLAKKIGPINFDDKCDPYDVAKNLTSDYVKKKFGLS